MNRRIGLRREYRGQNGRIQLRLSSLSFLEICCFAAEWNTSIISSLDFWRQLSFGSHSTYLQRAVDSFLVGNNWMEAMAVGSSWIYCSMGFSIGYWCGGVIRIVTSNLVRVSKASSIMCDFKSTHVIDVIVLERKLISAWRWPLGCRLLEKSCERSNDIRKYDWYKIKWEIYRRQILDWNHNISSNWTTFPREVWQERNFIYNRKM